MGKKKVAHRLQGSLRVLVDERKQQLPSLSFQLPSFSWLHLPSRLNSSWVSVLLGGAASALDVMGATGSSDILGARPSPPASLPWSSAVTSSSVFSDGAALALWDPDCRDLDRLALLRPLPEPLGRDPS